MLISSDYYPALSRSNVQVVTDSVLRIEADGVITADGVKHPADCLIFGTGFQATDPLPRDCIIGRHGVDLMDAWHDGAHAYKGSTVPGYPNLFLIIGPNTGRACSMILMIEAQVAYILDALQQMQRHRIATVEVKPAVEQAYNHQLRDKLTRTIWNTGGCRRPVPRPSHRQEHHPVARLDLALQADHPAFALKDYVASMAPIDAAPRAMAAPFHRRGACHEVIQWPRGGDHRRGIRHGRALAGLAREGCHLALADKNSQGLDQTVALIQTATLAPVGDHPGAGCPTGTPCKIGRRAALPSTARST